jgi:two-component system, OmpR family, sensor histidine kinase KdpD
LPVKSSANQFLSRIVAPYGLSLGLVAGTTLLLKALEQLLGPENLTVLFLVPVLICALRFGPGPAFFASVLSVGSSAMFIYEPLFSLRVADEHHLTHLAVFLTTAIVVGGIAHDARRNATELSNRRSEAEGLYRFSRRLASASSLTAIYAAIREHLTAELGDRLLLVVPPIAGSSPIGAPEEFRLPAEVESAVGSALAGQGAAQYVEIPDADGFMVWILKSLHPSKPELGFIVICTDRRKDDRSELRRRIDNVLSNAVSSLERLDVGRALEEARMRAGSETLREALIGSVTHDLRTPLATIVGSASILSKVSTIKSEEQLADLASLISTAAVQLDLKISNLIGATRISIDGLKPELAWVDPTDIVNAALHESATLLTAHEVVRDVPLEPPLIETDPVLLKEVLRQLLDNAVKYSPPGSTIHISITVGCGALLIAVKDAGDGMNATELNHAFQRFYRGPSQAGRRAGSGLGLWISQSFAAACRAKIAVESQGPGAGTQVTVTIPLSHPAGLLGSGAIDE